jgi:hypothetical protein
MVPTAPADHWRGPLQLADQLERQRQSAEDAAPLRVYRRPIWALDKWAKVRSDDRLVETLTWDRATVWPKHNLSTPCAVSEVHGTMMPHDYQVFLWYIKRRGGGTIPLGEDLAATAVDCAVLRVDESLRSTEDVESAAEANRDNRDFGSVAQDVSIWRTPDAMPRTWFVSEVKVLPSLDTDDWRVVWRRTAEVFHPEGWKRDLRREAVVEAGIRDTSDLRGNGAGAADKLGLPRVPESCRITCYEPTRVEIKVEIPQTGLVVLADQYFPGWQAEIETDGQAARRVPILRTNRVMRGVCVPEGKHRVVFRYRPASVAYGGMISLTGWLALAVWGVSLWWRGRAIAFNRKRIGLREAQQ